MAPTEGFNDETPVARGRRDPQLAVAMEAEQLLANAGEESEVDVFGLLPGDTVLAKITVAGKTPVGDGWYTYGIQSRVADNESEEDAFIRVNEIVNSRVLQMATENIERIEAEVAAAPPPRRGQIRPRK